MVYPHALAGAPDGRSSRAAANVTAVASSAAVDTAADERPPTLSSSSLGIMLPSMTRKILDMARSIPASFRRLAAAATTVWLPTDDAYSQLPMDDVLSRLRCTITTFTKAVELIDEPRPGSSSIASNGSASKKKPT